MASSEAGPGRKHEPQIHHNNNINDLSVDRKQNGRAARRDSVNKRDRMAQLKLPLVDGNIYSSSMNNSESGHTSNNNNNNNNIQKVTGKIPLVIAPSVLEDVEGDGGLHLYLAADNSYLISKPGKPVVIRSRAQNNNNKNNVNNSNAQQKVKAPVRDLSAPNRRKKKTGSLPKRQLVRQHVPPPPRSRSAADHYQRPEPEPIPSPPMMESPTDGGRRITVQKELFPFLMDSPPRRPAEDDYHQYIGSYNTNHNNNNLYSWAQHPQEELREAIPPPYYNHAVREQQQRRSAAASPNIPEYRWGNYNRARLRSTYMPDLSGRGSSGHTNLY